MKQANITLKLSKDAEVHLTNVTPIEALLLVAEHHKNCGGNPVEIVPGTVKDIVIPTEGTPAIPEVKDAVGKVTQIGVAAVPAGVRSRTNDEEIDRLRAKYHFKKLDQIAQVRDLPDTFEKAIERGIKLLLPTNALLTKG